MQIQTLLVVEDEAFVAFELKNVLEEAGYRVLTAWSLDAAMPLVESGVIALAVIDLGLPAPSDGARVARHLNRHGIPLLVCTGLPAAEAQATLGPVEPIGLLRKPAAPDAVLAAVRAALPG